MSHSYQDKEEKTGKEKQEPTRRSLHVSAELAATLTEKWLNRMIKVIKIEAIVLQVRQSTSVMAF